MNREYVRWYSPALQKDMELLVFGHSGSSILFFPARMGRFYDYENWKVIEALRHKIEAGHLQVYCVDSVDRESFYNGGCNPAIKIARHIQYEQYILNEVVPFIRGKNPGSYMIAAGCSLGAYHALNITLRHPGLFNKVVGMSGRYDLANQIGHYDDLFNGYWDENIYFNMPSQYIPNLTDKDIVANISHIEVVLVVGHDDVLLENNRYLNNILSDKGAKVTLHIWDKEAHRARFWRQMVAVYL